jgi:hypothetical protein
VTPSLDDQIRVCREYAERHDWQWQETQVYVDAAVSGASIDGRAGVQALLSGTMASGHHQVVAAGNTYLLFYQDSGAGPAALNPLHTTLTNVSSFNIGTGRKLTSCENGLVFDYNPGAGGGKIYGLSADASASTGIYADDVGNHGIVLRAYGTEGFGAGWSTIIGIGVLE